MSGHTEHLSFSWCEQGLDGCDLVLDPAPPAAFLKHVIEEIGRLAKDAMKVEVPFESLLQKSKFTQDLWWKGSTALGVEVPLGPKGARDVQSLILGKGMAHHGLIVGRPGSGKTNLMHVIIVTLGLIYQPDEMELYLVDFKKGVGFKSYADEQMPHAKVIAIESEREFGLSVLQGLDAELKRRGEMFRAQGVENISEFREKSRSKLPRILLVADEFQEFFTSEDSIASESRLLIDRLVRQGRAFGMHMLLGTQTLAGSHGLQKGTMDQMAIRIALQCSETDSRMILADDNPAARLLSRPGEAIYNPSGGLIEGNSRFQVALFTDEDKIGYLKRIRDKACNESPECAPIVFEGYEPARVERCQPLSEALKQRQIPRRPDGLDAWIGEPIALRPPLAARFRRQSGSNLLVVTKEEMEGLGVIASVVLSLMAQEANEALQFIIFDYALQDLEWVKSFHKLADASPHEFEMVKRREMSETLHELVGKVEMLLSADAPPSSSTFVIFQGIHRARDLRLDDGYADSQVSRDLAKLIIEGPEAGVHFVCWTESGSSLERIFERKTLREFSMRTVGAMGDNDLRNLIDNSAAQKLDKPHRMIFCDEDRPGSFEKFRPYAVPDDIWLEQFIQKLSQV